ncbi:MAG: trehalose-phosphatase [Methanocellales archaeon]|nr:trehalose-phosphatase [Methanocellales archaeon]
MLPKILLLMDYDGTLTPIVDRPELAVLSDDVRDVLKQTSKRYPTAIISGRSLKDIKNMVKVKEIYYAGNHGFEISGPEIELIKDEAKLAKPVILKICNELQEKLSHMNGAIVENKGLTASVHYRLVSKNDFPELKKVFEELTKPYLERGDIKITSGKKVFEIRPNVDWDKGRAVLWIMNALNIKDGLAIYMGDDKTDEDAFLALKNKGITILISERTKKSNAKYFLRDVSDVKAFLGRLISLS